MVFHGSHYKASIADNIHVSENWSSSSEHLPLLWTVYEIDQRPINFWTNNYSSWRSISYMFTLSFILQNHLRLIIIYLGLLNRVSSTSVRRLILDNSKCLSHNNYKIKATTWLNFRWFIRSSFLLSKPMFTRMFSLVLVKGRSNTTPLLPKTNFKRHICHFPI